LSGKRLLVISWNIHRCVGTDGRQDPDRIARVLRRLNADVVGLQEVESGGSRSSDQLAYLAERTGRNAVAGPTLRQARCDYGNGLLSRFPVQVVRRHLLPGSSRREPRGLLEAELEHGGERLRVLVTHLALDRNDRSLQVAALQEHLDPSPVVMLGDFNDWLPWPFGVVSRSLAPLLGRGHAPRTFPSHFPLFSLDRVWVRPRERLIQINTVDGEARVASDHLPLRAVVAGRGDESCAATGEEKL
jgi:endonuclease/exonuclease/phosphatase family metal-dependent hydrolase